MESKFELFKELIEISQKEKRGLTVFVGGQQIAGIVTKNVPDKAIEMRSQTFGKIIVCVEAIDAAAIN